MQLWFARCWFLAVVRLKKAPHLGQKHSGVSRDFSRWCRRKLLHDEKTRPSHPCSQHAGVSSLLRLGSRCPCSVYSPFGSKISFCEGRGEVKGRLLNCWGEKCSRWRAAASVQSGWSSTGRLRLSAARLLLLVLMIHTFRAQRNVLDLRVGCHRYGHNTSRLPGHCWIEGCFRTECQGVPKRHRSIQSTLGYVSRHRESQQTRFSPHTLLIQALLMERSENWNRWAALLIEWIHIEYLGICSPWDAGVCALRGSVPFASEEGLSNEHEKVPISCSLWSVTRNSSLLE